jgi:hypothetical protein
MRRPSVRHLAAFALLALAGALGSGCGLSRQEAEDACNVELDARDLFVSSDDFEECVTCYETCAYSCRVEGSPLTFTCPE